MIQPSAFRLSPADQSGSRRRTRCPTASYTTLRDTIQTSARSSAANFLVETTFWIDGSSERLVTDRADEHCAVRSCDLELSPARICERAMDDGACPAIFGGGWDASSEIGCTLQGQSRDEKRASRILAYSTVAPIA